VLTSPCFDQTLTSLRTGKSPTTGQRRQSRVPAP
jgi:hypothetical protein